MKNLIPFVFVMFCVLGMMTQTETKLTASDGVANDNYGEIKCIDDDRAIIGVKRDDNNGSNSDSVFIYDWDGKKWNETKITASDTEWQDDYGFSVNKEADRSLLSCNAGNSGCL